MLLVLLTLAILTRVYNYLPFNTLAMEITILFICTVFYVERINYIDEYNTCKDSEVKKELEEKITNKKSHLNLAFGFFFIIVLAGYYDFKSTKSELIKLDVFTCKSKNGFEIYVDKKERWVLSDDFYFIKGKSKINAFSCKKVEEQ